MRWTKRLGEVARKKLRNWLEKQPLNAAVTIMQYADIELEAIRNRIWYRGDSFELEQFYTQTNIGGVSDRYKFWASTCSPGMEMRKIHTGLPALVVKVLASIVMADMNGFEFEDEAQRQIWDEADRKNDFKKKLQKAIREMLYLGDGAWKVKIDTSRSDYPILQWYPGDRIEMIYNGDELEEVVFKTPYSTKDGQYVLCEHYGHGYIKNRLYREDKEVLLSVLSITENLQDWNFDKKLMLAVPMYVYESAKWDGRGGSIYDGKLDSFDAFDEAWSQWMDALRAGRARTYIPESYIPRDPDTGEMMKPNGFDNRFIKGEDNMSEGGKNLITTEQPAIPHESYSATYVTALDLCLQGIISPSTLGIDTKKMDNAEAQREKEKTTLYTRNAIIDALQNQLPTLVNAYVNAYHVLRQESVVEVTVNIPFGEYANPSFESQIETVAKGKQGGIMSIEASVEELYGDSKDPEWKQEEVARLKAEQGIAELDEPEVITETSSFTIGFQGGGSGSES